LAEENMWHLAVTDPLTGLANYRRLIDFFQAETERSKRTGRSFGVLLLDLDGFKQMNDDHGHVVGNSALKHFAQALRLQCRSIDLPARFGGDEFAVILPESEIEGPFALARRLRTQLTEDAGQPKVSFSFGTAVWPDDGRTFEELLEMADRNLYAMKTTEQNHLPLPNGNQTRSAPDFSDTLENWLARVDSPAPIRNGSWQRADERKLCFTAAASRMTA
jgi:diguanylate cyclase (GGDEF)-like protein